MNNSVHIYVYFYYGSLLCYIKYNFSIDQSQVLVLLFRQLNINLNSFLNFRFSQALTYKKSFGMYSRFPNRLALVVFSRPPECRLEANYTLHIYIYCKITRINGCPIFFQNKSFENLVLKKIVVKTKPCQVNALSYQIYNC